MIDDPPPALRPDKLPTASPKVDLPLKPDKSHMIATLFHRLIVVGSIFVLAQLTLATASAAPRNGEQIYKKDCARCHGPSGEGAEEYPKPLAGDKSVGQLARLIAKTMPDDDPGACTGDDASSVAAYIHDAFYSKTAQARAKPPRIELSRLTVRQYRNALADLLGAFRDAPETPADHGLRGRYFKSREPRDDEEAVDRTDPTVNFDFGFTTPEPELIEPPTFSIRWQGSVFAPETGEYDFIVRTQHATRLWVNDAKTPLIDAWVKSGGDTEYHASLTLLGGRAYPIRLEFSKAKQGVDDSKDKKTKPRPPVHSSMALAWKPPHHTIEIIPARNLSPSNTPQTFVVSVPFPPDDRSVGYERGTSISKAWDQAATDSAIETAEYVAGHLKELANLNFSIDSIPTLRDQFLVKFVERAFRRPLTPDLKSAYIDRPFNNAKDPETALKRVILLALKSPRFLYRELGSNSPDDFDFDVASRIAFSLWDSIPDKPLLEEARSGRLHTRKQVLQQAERMAGDPRAHAKIRQFFLQWLKVEQPPDLSKDPAIFPGFNPQIASHLRTSLDLFLDDVVWSETSDFRRLLLADDLYLNGPLSAFYHAGLPPDADFQKVKLNPEARSGLISHPYLLAAFAYTASTSPIHRGVFLSRSVLGRTLRPPPIAVAPLAPSLHPNMNTRERVTLQTSPQACITCHAMINPLGFSLEHFDAVGRFRDSEMGRPIDSSGAYESPSGAVVSFSGARDLAAALADSDETHAAFVEQLFHHLVKQPIRAYGLLESSNLRKSFAANHYHIRKLIIEMIASAALPPLDLKTAKSDN